MHSSKLNRRERCASLEVEIHVKKMYYLCSVNRPKAFELRSVLLYLQVHFQALGNEVKYLLPFALGGLVEGVEAAKKGSRAAELPLLAAQVPLGGVGMGLVVEDVGMRWGDEAASCTLFCEVEELLRIELRGMSEALRDVDVEHVGVCCEIVFEEAATNRQWRMEQKEETTINKD